ncbi:MAG: outer membrane beta-barrel protein [Candidatus Kapaibacteriota bacterium]|jgi:hypothetical protein
MKKLSLLTVAFALFVSVAALAQTGRWTHQVGIEVGPQYAFDASATASDGQKLTLKDVGVGFGAAVNYYYKFDRALFLSVSGAFGIFDNGYFRRQNADGSFPILNSFYFKNNALTNFAFTAGLRYNFAVTGLQPYAGLEVGSYFIGNGSIKPEGSQAVSVNLAVTPKAGIRYPLQPGLDFDASVKLIALVSGYVPFSYASLNVGVSYALNFQND